jgi:hypothetical protein
MNRHLAIPLLVVLFASWVPAWGAQTVVDEQQVFAYSSAVQAGNRKAVRAVFALNTDGASAEAQDVVLGKLIIVRPQLFLEELQRSQFASCKWCLDGLLGNLGDDYVDRPTAQLRQLKKRREAFRTVHENPVVKLRNECIASLTEQIQTLHEVIGWLRR